MGGSAVGSILAIANYFSHINPCRVLASASFAPTGRVPMAKPVLPVTDAAHSIDLNFDGLNINTP
jgi:hypothetical protein